MKCDNCHEREAKGLWGGTLDGINVARMMSTLPSWCELCMVRAQVEHMSKIAAELPERQKRLAELEAQHV